MPNRLPLVLLILDGWGLAPPGSGNALTQARLTVVPRLMKTYGAATLSSYGAAVGLPPRQVGNSEAGHMNLGAGRVVEQDAVRINRAIDEGRFFKNPAFLDAVRYVKRKKSRLHLMGLLTEEGSGHAFPLHLWALLSLADRMDCRPVYVHLFTDGRDTSQFRSARLIERTEHWLARRQSIATVMGRLWAMDRAKRWERTERAYDALVTGAGERAANAQDAVLSAYERHESDEFIAPTVIGSPEEVAESRVQDHDAVVFFNLRSDRARQLTKALVQENFSKKNPRSFRRRKVCKQMVFIAMTDFGPDLPSVLTAFPSIDVPHTLPMELSDLRQLYIAEQEKYAHVTYFFNGGYAEPIGGEERVVVPSANVASFVDKPEMSTPVVAKHILASLEVGAHDVIVANFANADMVGHTDNLRAGSRAAKIIDQWIGAIWKAVQAKHGTLVITGDHGNIETMRDARTGAVDTRHNANPVPLIIANAAHPVRLTAKGKLADVAPTLLRLLGKTPPVVMTGHSLLRS